MFTPDAFIIYQGTLYQPSVPFLLEKFVTPVCALIEGIWLTEPQRARAILRERIYTNYELTPACAGMIKVAAKRVSMMSNSEYPAHRSNALTNLKESCVSPRLSTPFDDSSLLHLNFTLLEARQLVIELKEKVKKNTERFESARSVGAVLLGEKGDLLSYAWNDNSVFKFQHAEHELLRSYVLRNQKKIPDRSTLIVSLKPCAMCAGQILSQAENFESLQILYLENDEGPMAQNSALVEGSSLWQSAGLPRIHIKQIY